VNVAVLGASPKPQRYSFKAIEMLKAHGHAVFPVRPGLASILDLKVSPRLTDVATPLHTVTVYIEAQKSSRLQTDILKARPARVIFNPGAENPDLAAELRRAGIRTLDACTLVLLTTGQFESVEGQC
jgi:uncharacterized protein